MGVESGVGYIDDLVVTNPESTDVIAEGDDHLRLTKQAVTGSFTSLGREAVVATAAELNVLNGSSATTADLNQLANAPNITILNIVDWNMDLTSSVTVAHGLTLSKILTVEGSIVNDLRTLSFPLSLGAEISGFTPGVTIVGWDSTDITLQRLTGGPFDSGNYNSVGGFVRGRLIVESTD